MKYLLDTSICIRYLNHRSASIIRRMNAESPEDIVVCSVTRAELIFGAMKSNMPEKTRAAQREFLEPLEHYHSTMLLLNIMDGSAPN